VQLLAVGFVVFMVLTEVVSMYVQVDVYMKLHKSWETKDRELYSATVPMMGMIIVQMAADNAARFCKWRMRKLWRLNSAALLIRKLFSEGDFEAGAFFRLQGIDGTKTPEQQICEDTRRFSDIMVDEVLAISSNLVAIFLAARTLYLEDPRLLAQQTFLVLAGGFAMGAIVPRLLAHRYMRVEQTLAQMRHLLGRVQRHVETIALFRGASSELVRFRGCHVTLIRRKEILLRAVGGINAANRLITTLVLLFPTVVLLRRVLGGQCTVANGVVLFTMLQKVQDRGMSVLGLPGSVANAGVFATRLLQLVHEADFIEAESARRRGLAGALPEAADDRVQTVYVTDAGGPVLELESLTLWTPARPGRPRQVLLEGLALRLSDGESLLVTGEAGVGKTALVFALLGLWDSGRGSVRRCENSGVFCVPQQPYMFQGTLRDQLVYPSVGGDVTDGELWDMVRALNMGEDLQHYSLDDKCPWTSILSLGQQQRVTIARALLVRKPRLVIVDSGTSALDVENEARAYDLLRSHAPCLVSTGHRPSLFRHHSHILPLQHGAQGPSCSATMVPMADFDPSVARDAAPAAAGSSRAAAPPKQELPPADAGGAAPPVSVKGKDQVTPEGWLVIFRCIYKVIAPLLMDRSHRLWTVVVVAGSAVVPLANTQFGGLAVGRYEALLKLLEEQDSTAVWSFLQRNAWFVPVQMVIAFYSAYWMGMTSNYIVETLREGLSSRYLGCHGIAFYHLHNEDKLDNPSDLIAGFDTETIGGVLVGIAFAFIGALSFVAFNMFQVFQVVPQVGLLLTVSLSSLGILVYSNFAWPATKTFMLFLERNALLRQSIMHTCANAGTVALQQGGHAEYTRQTALAHAAIDRSFHYLFLNEIYKIIDNMVDITIQAMAVVGTAPYVMDGTLEYGEAMAILMRVLSVNFAVRGFFEMLCRIAPAVCSAARVRFLVMTLEEAISRPAGCEGISMEELEDTTETALALEDLCLRTPRSTCGRQAFTLVTGITATLPAKSSLLIAGESGIGKSSLLRALGGLWSNGTGAIRRCGEAASFFVAQKPYLCLGNLRDQLLYPDTAGGGDRDGDSDDKLREVAKAVGLEHLLASPGLDGQRHEGPDAMLDTVEWAMHWTSELSQGEVQSINFARLLLRPHLRLVLLDEGSAAMDVGHEASMYKLLGQHVETYVSVAHRPQLRSFHSHALVLGRHAEDTPAAARFLPMGEYELELSAGAAP